MNGKTASAGSWGPWLMRKTNAATRNPAGSRRAQFLRNVTISGKYINAGDRGCGAGRPRRTQGRLSFDGPSKIDAGLAPARRRRRPARRGRIPVLRLPFHPPRDPPPLRFRRRAPRPARPTSRPEALLPPLLASGLLLLPDRDSPDPDGRAPHRHRRRHDDRTVRGV